MRIVSLPSAIALALTLGACSNKIDSEGEVEEDSIIDIDGDGVPSDEDCDDGDASAYPGAVELCDGVDNDCDGSIDNDPVDGGTWYTDSDSDGWGDSDGAVSGCEQPAGTSEADGDCDDSDPAFYPGAPEDDCTDPSDYNCDGSVGYADEDGDGYAACEECDDGNDAVHPDAAELCNDIDDDCDGLIDGDDTLAKGEGGTWYADTDGDGHGDPDVALIDCEQPDDSAETPTDCDDSNDAVNPDETEVCNGIDDDCDSLIDGDDDSLDPGTLTTWFEDSDGDGFGDLATAVTACDSPGDTWVTNGDDCNDLDAAINPDADEICDELDTDEDCDGLADDEDSTASGKSTWNIDYDSDGFGSDAYTTSACDQPDGYVANDRDCDDADDEINPEATEVCDEADNDCDGLVDDADPGLVGASTWYRDTDGDGFGDPTTAATTCDPADDAVENSDDCDDSNDAVNPDADEICDGGIDNDCDGLRDDADDSVTDQGTWYADSDGDLYGDAATSTLACDMPDDYVADDGDCDDDDSAQYPGADEYCNEEDDDCDDEIDEDAVDGAWSALDEDGDGFGSTGSEVWTCSSDVENTLDCDDSDPDEPVVVSVTDGSSSGDGSMDSPYDTIQAGIDAAYACVVVEAGTYYEAIDFGGKDIEVTGADGAESTTIDATGTGKPAVTFQSAETSGATLSGFTVTGGEGSQEDTEETTDCSSVATCTTYTTTYCGGAIFIDGAGPTLDDLILQANVLPEYEESTVDLETWLVYSYGGGLCALGSSSPALQDISFIENYADQGGGLYVDESSAVSLDQVLFIANEATDGAAMEVDGGELTADNAASMWNLATDDAGGILGIDGDLTLVNVTLAGDDGGLSGALYASGATTTELTNSILSTDSSVATVGSDGSGTFTVTYSNVYNATGSAYDGVTDPTGSDGNLSEDPGFAAWSDDGDYTNDDLGLASDSVCIDAGNPDAAYSDTDDSRNDMGATGGPGGGDWL